MKASIGTVLRQRDSGFTLVELVVVIVIMGVLAAFAVPRFSNMSAEARAASVEAQFGSARSAGALAHSLSLTQQIGPSAPVTMEGAAVTMINRYPDAPGVITSANLDTINFQTLPIFGNLVLLVWANDTPGWTSCGFAYIRAVPGSAPTYLGPNTGFC